MLFRNPTHQGVWVDRWCHSCFQPDEAARRLQGKDTQCPILERALRTGRKPVEWDRTRNPDMERSIKCNAYLARPQAVTARPDKAFEDVPMFDIEPHEVHLVPVEGWPDPPTDGGVDHA